MPIQKVFILKEESNDKLFNEKKEHIRSVVTEETLKPNIRKMLQDWNVDEEEISVEWFALSVLGQVGGNKIVSYTHRYNGVEVKLSVISSYLRT